MYATAERTHRERTKSPQQINFVQRRENTRQSAPSLTGCREHRALGRLAENHLEPNGRGSLPLFTATYSGTDRKP